MMITRSAVTIVAFIAASGVLAGCASQKEPAEQAVAGIEKTLEGSGAQVQKYLPERYEEISARVAALRDGLAREQYRDVVADAPAVVDALRRAVADSAIRRAQARIEIEAEWAELVKTMPAMIAAVDGKLAAQAGRPPKGMDREAFKALVAGYDAARASWGKASAEVNSANFEAAVTTARDARKAVTASMEALGVQAS